MPPDPLVLFIFFNQLQICFAEKKYAWKNVKFMDPLWNFSLRHCFKHFIVKRFIIKRSTIGQQRLDALALLSIESYLLRRINFQKLI